MVLSNMARKESTIGEMVNIMAVNVNNLHEFAHHFHMTWTCVVSSIIGSFLLWTQLGFVASLGGLIVMVAVLPGNAAASNQQKRFQIKKLKHADARIKMINEMLNGIKVIKFYAWEMPFQRLINICRDAEIKILRKIAYFSIIPNLSWVFTPFLVKINLCYIFFKKCIFSKLISLKIFKKRSRLYPLVYTHS